MRSTDNKTQKELLVSLNSIFSFNKYDFLSDAEIELLNDPASILFNSRKYLEYDINSGKVIAILYDTDKNVVNGVSIVPYQTPETNDLDFGNYFCRVFNEDLRITPNTNSHHELWQTLRQTQFQRAIAKYSAFSTTPMTSWLQIIESTTSLRYEGKPFTYCLFMTKQEQWIKGAMKEYFVDFSSPIEFKQGMLSEKWIRAAVDGDRVGLVSLGHSGNLVGVYNIPPMNNLDKWPVAPHMSMVTLQTYLVEGTCLFVTSEYGDIYFLMPNGAIFQKTQGYWYYLNYNHILKVLTDFICKDLAIPVLQLALDLSYERNGALIVIPDNESDIEQMVPDHYSVNKISKTLRDSIHGLDLQTWPHRQIILSSAKSDGALIISNKGKVLDVACMISEPNTDALSSLGKSELKKFSGARSTAAWNASILGLAIKVSEDGPITIYNHGTLIARVG